MVDQTNQLFGLEYNTQAYFPFVFFSTLASYNFHWLLSQESIHEQRRIAWEKKRRALHILFLGVGLAGIFWWGSFFLQFWWQIGLAAGLTFLYTAPKIPLKIFTWLKKIAIGKTIFLAFVWTYVTSILPLILSETRVNNESLIFIFSRFFLVYAVCIIFDFRDRENDRKEGIRSMITSLGEKKIDNLYYFTLLLFVITIMAWYFLGQTLLLTAILMLPAFFLLFLYKPAKRNFSDYLYGFVLDGMMALSSLITLFMQI